MTSNKKKFYPSFPTDLLNNNWPFSHYLAQELFTKNMYNSYSSLRTFLIKTTKTDTGEFLDSDDSDVEGSDFQDCLIDSRLRLKNNTVYYSGWSDVEYEDSIKITDAKSGKIRFFVEYSLDNISYKTIVCEAIRYYIKYSVTGPYSQNVSGSLLCAEITFYLLYTTYSQFVKNLIEEEKYMEKYSKFSLEELLFESYMRLNYMEYEKKPLFLAKKRVNRKERLLNLLSFTPLEKDESEKLVDNFLSTGDLKQILSYYQEILKIK